MMRYAIARSTQEEGLTFMQCDACSGGKDRTRIDTVES
jgi:hypothetical protein